MQNPHLAVNMLSMEYADAIQELVSQPEIAAATRIPHPYPENGARVFIETSEQERLEGKSFVNAILYKKNFVGTCALMKIESGKGAEIGYWIGKPYWGQGFASFSVQTTLQTAFNNLRLPMVYATVLDFNPVSMRVLEKNGFTFKRKEPHNNPKWSPDALLHVYEITRKEWKEHVHGPLVYNLHADLAAGNEISGSGRGWPKSDSIIISLEKPFLANLPVNSPNVVYNDINDPHYWKAEYSTLEPIHSITCPFE